MSVVTELQAGNGQDLFYVLKITGLPYYICAVYNPFAAGPTWTAAAALALPAGYTAVGGMDLPDQTLDQSITDIIGGIASAEEIKLKLIDFTAHDANGEYRVLARAFSPGIATSTPGGYFELMSDIPCTHDTGDTVSVRSGTVTPADGFYTFGTETIEIENWSAPASGISTGTITGGRNRFPCSSVYPLIPYHRVVRNETDAGAIGRNILVTPYSAPFSMIGRSAAFYIGALDAAGAPLPEDQWQLRLVGKIAGVGRGDGGATFEIQIKSVIDELSGAVIAPGLGSARIKDDQILLPESQADQWLKCQVIAGNANGNVFRRWDLEVDGTGVADRNFTLDRLIGKVNLALSTLAFGTKADPIACRKVVGDDGLVHVAFQTFNQRLGGGADVGGVYGPSVAYSLFGGTHCFLSALGFTADDSGDITVVLDEKWSSSDGTTAASFRAVAPKPAPIVFIPATNPVLADPVRFAVTGLDGSSSQHFFTDQGDGRAYIECGDGTVIELSTVDATGGAHLTTSRRWRWVQGVNTPSYSAGDWGADPFYYVARGSVATVRQVVVAGDRDVDADAGLFVGRFLASHDEESALDDLNYYPEGVGLGLNQILDGDSVRAITAYAKACPRELVVNNETKLEDILKPILKYFGLVVVWDPETSRISFRPLRVPTAAGAHATIQLSDSTRTDVNDVTSTVEDASNIRGSWSLKYGYDPVEEKFTAPTMTIGDNTVKSTEVTWKPETIEDKTLWARAGFDPFVYLGELFGRGFLYRQPWIKGSRSFNRVGLTLAPGSYHPVVDALMVNPFTGKQGITAADALYAMLIGVQGNPQQPQNGSCTFLLNRYRKSSLFRSWSPTGLVDYDAAGHGYNTGTGVLTMAREYTGHATAADGVDFVVGDVVRMIARHAVNGALTYDEATSVLAVATDGTTVTVASGLTAIPDGTEVLLVLDAYGGQPAARTSEVAFQGDEGTMIVGGVGGTELHRWA